MVQDNETQKLKTNFINIINKFLPIIVITPTICGGIWQIFELSSMSMSYIRFFSITQLVADGILIIMVILPWIFGFIIFETYYSYIKNNNNYGKINIFLKIFIIIVMILGLFIYLKYFFLRMLNELSIDTYLGYLFFVATVYIIFFGLLTILGKFFVKCIELIIKMFKMNPIFYGLISIIICFTLFHYLFFIPTSLENIKNLPDGTIKYFNDKYIFIKLKQDDKEIQNDKNILVVKFDDLFKDEKN